MIPAYSAEITSAPFGILNRKCAGSTAAFVRTSVKRTSLAPPSGSSKRMRCGTPSLSHSSTALKSLSLAFGSSRRRWAPSSAPSGPGGVREVLAQNR